MRPIRALLLLAVVAGIGSCHLDRLVNSSGGGGGGPPPPGPPATLAFTVQPRGTMADTTIKPPVQVTARDSVGNAVTTFDGTIRVAIALDGSHNNAKLQGDTVATAAAGVATFTNLSIDQVGTGYKLSAALATGGPMGTSASFDVDSVQPPPPTTGDLTVGNTTTGSDLDPDGYTVTVDGGQSQPLSLNATTTYTGLPLGDHIVQISGVASNCTVSGANPRTVSVPAGATAQTSFAITCAPIPPTTGDLKVTTSTSGSNLPSGYTVAVDGGTGQPIGINNSTGVMFTGLTPGSHSVQLSVVAANCSVSGGATQTVNITAGQTATLAFSITCSATTGSIAVTTSTSGSNLPSDYSVAVDGGTGQAIGINTIITISGVPTGSRTVTLSGVASNCTVSGGTSQTVTVAGGQTASVTFSVTCSATTGSIAVTTNTSGSNLPSGYTVAVDGGTGQAIGINTTMTLTGIATGSHTVTLSGVASNCTVSGGTSRTANVTGGQTASVTFSVTCSAPPNQPPVAAFTSSCTALTCNFTSTSSDPDGSIAAYQWTFGDGGTATTQNPSHPYTAGGTYNVQLTVTDNQNATNSVTHAVTVTAPPPPNQPPVAAFTPSCTALTCTFTSTSSDPDGSISAYQWDFGDGGSATSQNPSHGYAAGGTYTVQLTVTDNQGATGTVSHSVTVTAPPPPNQPPVVTAGGNQSVLVGTLFTLSGASFSDPNHNGPWTITIDWGDGSSDVNTTSNEGSIGGSHSYVTLLPATYTVTITVTDAGGLSGSASKTVTVTTL